MPFSAPTLHPPVLVTEAHKALALQQLQALSRARRQEAVAFAFVQEAPGTVTLPLSTVSSNGMYDAQIEVRLRGGDPTTPIWLLLDSGNTCLIMPDLAAITGLANFAADYQILVDDVPEPWGANAAIVRGPIDLPTANGGVYSLSDCVAPRTSALGASQLGASIMASSCGRRSPTVLRCALPQCPIRLTGF